MVRPEPRVDEPAEKRIVEERHRKLLVVLELVVPVYANRLKVAPEGAHEHDEARHHGRAAVVRAQDDDVARAAGGPGVEVAAVELAQELGLVKLCGRVVLAREQVQAACMAAGGCLGYRRVWLLSLEASHGGCGAGAAGRRY